MTEDQGLARVAGLGDAWRDRGQEMAEAAALARRLAAAITHPADETAEPMPSYAVPAHGAARR